MLSRIFFFLVFFGFALKIFPQTDGSAGAVNFGMGNIRSLSELDGFIFKNPAAVSSGKYSWTMSTHTENRFLVEDFSIFGLSTIKKLNENYLSVGFLRTGNEYFNETRISTGYNLAATSKLRAGVLLNGYLQKFSQTDLSNTILTASMGLVYQLNSNISFGTYYRNFVQSKNENYQQKPDAIVIGVGYHQPRYSIYAEVEKEVTRMVNIKSGIFYKLGEKLNVSYGFNTQPFSHFAGIGLKTGNLQIQLSFGYIHALGLSPNASLTYLAP